MSVHPLIYPSNEGETMPVQSSNQSNCWDDYVSLVYCCSCVDVYNTRSTSLIRVHIEMSDTIQYINPPSPFCMCFEHANPNHEATWKGNFALWFDLLHGSYFYVNTCPGELVAPKPTNLSLTSTPILQTMTMATMLLAIALV